MGNLMKLKNITILFVLLTLSLVSYNCQLFDKVENEKEDEVSAIEKSQTNLGEGEQNASATENKESTNEEKTEENSSASNTEENTAAKENEEEKSGSLFGESEKKEEKKRK